MRQIATLIIATSIVQLANGFFGTLISLRVALEDFDATIASLVLSSYFAGFTIGASYSVRNPVQRGQRFHGKGDSNPVKADSR